jgi:dTDP-4-amino-4,6-dideoxygalactose transaminase
LSFTDRGLKHRIDLLKNFGIKNEDEVVMPGINGKMNEIQAALGLAVLECIEEEGKKRKLIRDTYISWLKDVDGISILEESKNVTSGHQYFPIRIDEKIFGRSRDYVYHRFKEYNVFTSKYFFPLCSDYPCYKQIPSAHPSHLPVAQRVVKEVLVLPFYGGLSVDDTTKICEILKSFKG